MTEQTDLEKITDVVTIVTATIGAILGALGFWRSETCENSPKLVFLSLVWSLIHVTPQDNLLAQVFP